MHADTPPLAPDAVAVGRTDAVMSCSPPSAPVAVQRGAAEHVAALWPPFRPVAVARGVVLLAATAEVEPSAPVAVAVALAEQLAADAALLAPVAVTRGSAEHVAALCPPFAPVAVARGPVFDTDADDVPPFSPVAVARGPVFDAVAADVPPFAPVAVLRVAAVADAELARAAAPDAVVWAAAVSLELLAAFFWPVAVARGVLFVHVADPDAAGAVGAPVAVARGVVFDAVAADVVFFWPLVVVCAPALITVDVDVTNVKLSMTVFAGGEASPSVSMVTRYGASDLRFVAVLVLSSFHVTPSALDSQIRTRRYSRTRSQRWFVALYVVVPLFCELISRFVIVSVVPISEKPYQSRLSPPLSSCASRNRNIEPASPPFAVGTSTVSDLERGSYCAGDAKRFVTPFV